MLLHVFHRPSHRNTDAAGKATGRRTCPTPRRPPEVQQREDTPLGGGSLSPFPGPPAPALHPFPTCKLICFSSNREAYLRVRTVGPGSVQRWAPEATTERLNSVGIVGRPLGPPMTGAIFSGDTMVQVGQARLHGPSKAGDPQAVQVKAAPVRARNVRPDKLRGHRPTVGGVIDLAGMVSYHVYEPPARKRH